MPLTTNRHYSFSFLLLRPSISLSLPPFRFIFYPRQRLVQVFFHTVEMIGFLFPSPPLVGSTPRKSILLLLFLFPPPPLLVRWFFIEKEASCQIWRFISTRLGRLSLSPFRLPLLGVEERGGDANFYCSDSIVSCRYDISIREIFLSLSFVHSSNISATARNFSFPLPFFGTFHFCLII